MQNPIAAALWPKNEGIVVISQPDDDFSDLGVNQQKALKFHGVYLRYPS
jgi:hypothetical protein